MSTVSLQASSPLSLKPRYHSAVMNEEEAEGYMGTGVTKPCVTAVHSWTEAEEWQSVRQA